MEGPQITTSELLNLNIQNIFSPQIFGGNSQGEKLLHTKELTIIAMQTPVQTFG